MAHEDRCPVCGKDITNQVSGKRSRYKMRNYLFCGDNCKQRFDRSPEEFCGRQKSEERASRK